MSKIMDSKFAPVCPARAYKQFNKADSFGLNHLMLAHDVVDNEEEYREALAPMVASELIGIPNIIMDNSLIECGMSVDDDLVAQACLIMSDIFNGAAFITPVLADVLGDAQASTMLSIECAHKWLQRTDLSRFGWVFVAQGSTEEESISSTEAFMHGNPSVLVNKIRKIAVPRIVTQKCGSRIKAAKFAARYRPVHLLGFSDNVYDDLEASDYAASIDSAVPMRCKSQWSPSTQMPPREDWWDNAEKDSANMLENLAIARFLFKS